MQTCEEDSDVLALRLHLRNELANQAKHPAAHAVVLPRAQEAFVHHWPMQDPAASRVRRSPCLQGHLVLMCNRSR